MLYLLIIVAVLGLCALTLIFLAVRKRAQKKQAERQRREELKKAQEPVYDWLERVDKAGNSNRELAAIPDPPEVHEEWGFLVHMVANRMGRVTGARSRMQLEAERERQDREILDGLLARVNNPEGSLVDRFGAALAIKFDKSHISWRLTESEFADLRNYLQGNLQGYVDTLLTAARGGDRDSFIELAKLTLDVYDQQYEEITRERYEDPEDWDDLVVRFHENPKITDFRWVNEKQSPGAVRHMAARALEQRSLKEAQIVLAFCSLSDTYYSGRHTYQKYWPWRDEIGNVLLAELTKMVRKLQIEQNCVFASAQEV